MGMFSVFTGKGLKNQRFNYKPRHYDPMIDDLHRRLKMGKYKMEEGAVDNIEMMKDRLKVSMQRNALQNIKQKKKALFSKNLRLLAVLCILILATYYMLIIYLPRLEAWIGA